MIKFITFIFLLFFLSNCSNNYTWGWYIINPKLDDGYNNILFQEYNMLKNDLRNSIQQICDFLNITLSNTSQSQLLNNFNRDAQLNKIMAYRRSNKFKVINIINNIFYKINPTSFLQRGILYNIDKNTSLHHKHINVKNNINWKSYYSKEQQEIIKAIIGDWLIDAGYEEDYGW